MASITVSVVLAFWNKAAMSGKKSFKLRNEGRRLGELHVISKPGFILSSDDATEELWVSDHELIQLKLKGG